MAGRIDVASEVDKGSTFTVTLPFETETHGDVPYTVQRRIAGYSGPRRRILVVDDDEANRHLVVRMLGDVGFELQESPNVEDALLHLDEQNAPDLIVTDLAMPRLSGLDLARRVRSSDISRSTPIVAISASASVYTREEALAAGCDDFVAKPLRAEELLNSVGRLLRLSWHMIEIHAPKAADAGATTAGIVVDEARATELYDLAMKGDIKELLARADSASAGDPAAAPVYEEVQRLARRFDFKGIRRVLDLARERNS